MLNDLSNPYIESKVVLTLIIQYGRCMNIHTHLMCIPACRY